MTAPHISLALLPEDIPPPSVELFAPLASRTDPFIVDAPRIDRFPGDEGVVYLAIRTNDALAALHGAVHTALDSEGTPMNPLYLGRHWVPHCTLGLGVRPTLADALCRELPAPGELRVNRLRSVHYGQQRVLWQYPLAGED